MRMRFCFITVFFMVAMLLTACGSESSNVTESSSSKPESSSDYPMKPVDMLVAFSPGGATDRVARSVADKVSEIWEEPVEVINKEGGSGTVGTVEAIQSKPDGYTVLMSVTSAGLTNPAIKSDLPYKWDDFTFISRINTSPLVVIVKADSKWETLEELVEDVKKDPTDFSYGTSGPGGPSTFGTAQIMEQAGIDLTKLTQVVLGGGSETVTAVAGGQVDFAAQNLSEVIEMIKGEKLRGLAISNDERAKVLPDVPTAQEAGFEEFSFRGWNGVVGPPNIPEEVVERWNEVVKTAMEDQEFTENLESQGLIPAYQGPEDFEAFLEDSFDTAYRIAEQTDIRE